MPSIGQRYTHTYASCPKSPHGFTDIHPIHDGLAGVHKARNGSSAITTHVGRLFGNEDTQPAIA